MAIVEVRSVEAAVGQVNMDSWLYGDEGEVVAHRTYVLSSDDALALGELKPEEQVAQFAKLIQPQVDYDVAQKAQQDAALAKGQAAAEVVQELLKPTFEAPARIDMSTKTVMVPVDIKPLGEGLPIKR